ncbi:putative steroid monooxygenase [Metarhizium anisopliae]|nr:putative steroid monooxygenase [Metarhizium anisopliae]
MSSILDQNPVAEERGATGGMAKGPPDRYQIVEKALGEARDLRIITVGAGASGLNLAYQIDKHMQRVTHVVYEKNPEVGGTWYENKYPGCACDIPSHNYQFTWEPNPEWTNFYSSAPEILEYFKRLATKYELYRFIKLGHKVIHAAWDGQQGIWNVKIENVSDGSVIDDWCHFLISGSGILNNWKWPDIPGIDSFRGQLLHSAAWDPSADWRGKSVAVLGCGSSGIQIIPTIQPGIANYFYILWRCSMGSIADRSLDVKKLITFIRTPTWITAGLAQSKAGPGGANLAFSEEQKQTFRGDPKAYMDYRKDIESEINSRFKFIIKDSPEQEEAVRFTVNGMKEKLGKDSPLLKHILPTFAIGCRRPTPGNGYLEALTKENVRVVTDAISEIVPEGIKTSTGDILKVDMLICATGFDMSFCPRYPVIGQDGISLADQWKDKPEAYLSLAVPNFPNHFMFLGPNAPTGHGSVLPIVEHAAKYIIQMLYKCQTEGIKSVAPKQEAVADFAEHIDVFMKRTAWSTHCRSWFKNGKVDGPVVALHPGSRIHWFHMLEKPRFEDFDWQTFGRNRFAYLGNGFSTKENPGRDTTYYFDNPYEGYRSIMY